MFLRCFLAVTMSLLAIVQARADDAEPAGNAQPAPTTQPSTRPVQEGVARLRHLLIDLKDRQIRVDCQALCAHMPLEFFCVERGGQEHESVLRTEARPSLIHFGLLAMGLKPGEPAHLAQADHTWFPPTGPPLKISCEYSLNGKTLIVPANRMMRSVKAKQEMPPMSWVFDGSRILPDGRYAADLTGYVVSIVNFDMTMIDVPELASNANETLEWEYNPDMVPPQGAPVTMIIEPGGPNAATQPAQGMPADQYNPGPGLNGGN